MSPVFGPSGAVHGEPVTLVPAGTRTAAGTGATVEMAERSTLRLTLNVTAASGTSPTATVTIEHSRDGSTWTAHSSFAAATAVGSQRKVFGGLDNLVRATWTMGGTTPSFTFSITGEAI